MARRRSSARATGRGATATGARRQLHGDAVAITFLAADALGHREERPVRAVAPDAGLPGLAVHRGHHRCPPPRMHRRRRVPRRDARERPAARTGVTEQLRLEAQGHAKLLPSPARFQQAPGCPETPCPPGEGLLNGAAASGGGSRAGVTPLRGPPFNLPLSAPFSGSAHATPLSSAAPPSSSRFLYYHARMLELRIKRCGATAKKSLSTRMQPKKSCFLPDMEQEEMHS